GLPHPGLHRLSGICGGNRRLAPAEKPGPRHRPVGGRAHRHTVLVRGPGRRLCPVVLAPLDAPGLPPQPLRPPPLAHHARNRLADAPGPLVAPRPGPIIESAPGASACGKSDRPVTDAPPSPAPIALSARPSTKPTALASLPFLSLQSRLALCLKEGDRTSAPASTCLGGERTCHAALCESNPVSVAPARHRGRAAAVFEPARSLPPQLPRGQAG